MCSVTSIMKKQLKNFAPVEDITQVPRFTFVRYIIRSTDADTPPKLCIGGKLLRASTEYVLLANRRSTWSVPYSQNDIPTTFYQYVRQKKPKQKPSTMVSRPKQDSELQKQVEKLEIQTRYLFEQVEKLQRENRKLQTALAQAQCRQSSPN